MGITEIIRQRARMFKHFYVLAALLALGAGLVSCEQAEDSLRNWGLRERRPAVPRLDDEEVARWERDLNISRARSLELHEQIQEIVQESNHQGMLAWKIGKAYMQAGRYDMGALYMQEAVAGEPAREPEAGRGVQTFDLAIPYFEAALRRHSPEPDLLFDAGLCFANASRANGWERNRWRTAVYLFQRMLRVAPEDVRPRYQLALLYGKTVDPEVRDVPLAIELLEDLIARSQRDVSARFLLGHLYAANDELDRAAAQYRNILEILEAMHREGLLPGSLNEMPRYRQARENLDTLESLEP